MKQGSFSRAALAMVTVLLAGCETRSISNAGYDHAYRYGQNPAEAYNGELSELDVVGVSPSSAASDAEIAAALRDKAKPQLERNSRVLLIQSGADFPDEPMVTALSTHFQVLPFSGRPRASTATDDTYSRSLRLAAARGGYDKIICYWGVLESEQLNRATKAVSWVPIAGFFVPDQQERMRIRLKAVIVDVATGRWTFVTPAPIGDVQDSSIVTRRAHDQDLVSRLKATGYAQLVQQLVGEHTS